MAHLTRGREGRAQILIVAAFALGVLFVALALILNSAIFTENLASRGQTTGGENVIKYQDALQRGAGDILTYENENVTDAVTHGTLESRIQTGLADLDTILIRRGTKAGATSSLALTGRADGSLVRQTEVGNFTDSSGSENWTLATDVNQTRAFRLNVSGSTSDNCTRFNNCSLLSVNTSSDDWQLSINNTSGIVVEVDNGTAPTETCGPVSGSHVVVDVTGGTVGNESCPALNFSEAPASEYDIRYENGGAINGTYSMVVDNASLATVGSPHYSSTTGANPVATNATYNISIEYDYQSDNVNYSSEIRVAPGESDE